MDEMRAAVITKPGDPEVLAIKRVTIREPGRGEVRIRVRAAGINRADLLQRRGLYPPPPGWPADIPGLEYAGEVEALGTFGSRSIVSLVCSQDPEGGETPPKGTAVDLIFDRKC